MHTSVSGCGHFLVASDADAIDLAQRYLAYMPQSWREAPPSNANAVDEIFNAAAALGTADIWAVGHVVIGSSPGPIRK